MNSHFGQVRINQFVPVISGGGMLERVRQHRHEYFEHIMAGHARANAEDGVHKQQFAAFQGVTGGKTYHHAVEHRQAEAE